MGSPRLLSALQRFALRTERGFLRPLWRAAYGIAARAYGWWLRGLDREASVYLRSAREPAYGLSDIDLAVITDRPDPVLARRALLHRLLPTLCDAILDAPLVLPAGELERLDSPPLYSSSPQRVRLAEKPGLYGTTSGWRLIAGPARLPPALRRSSQERRTAAWLELQTRWRWFFQGLCQPPG
ncbi:MAG: hypothetical protein ACJ766_14850, partial [Thermoleophilaceae bacterium]